MRTNGKKGIYLKSQWEPIIQGQLYYGDKGIWKTSHCGNWDKRCLFNTYQCEYHNSWDRYVGRKKANISDITFEYHNSIYWTLEKLFIIKYRLKHKIPIDTFSFK